MRIAKGRSCSEPPLAQSYTIETRSKTRTKVGIVPKPPTSEMSATETVTVSEAGQIPRETGQINPVPVNQTQLQQDRSSKPQKPKRNSQTGMVGFGTSSAMAATTGTVQTTRASIVNAATSGPSTQMERMGTVVGTGPQKRQEAGKLVLHQCLQRGPTHYLQAEEHVMPV